MENETKIDYLQIFRNRLKCLRGKKSLQEVAEDIGISRATLGYYESGERKPDIEILLKIARYYNVSCDYLLGLTEYSLPDINSRAFFELTGLNEEAIGNLYYYNHLKEDERMDYYYISTVNFLLSSSCRLIHQIAGYLNLNFEFASEIKYGKSEHDFEVSDKRISLNNFMLFDEKHSVVLRANNELLNKALLLNIQDELIKLRELVMKDKPTHNNID